MHLPGSISRWNTVLISLWILPCDITVFHKIPKLLKEKLRTSVTVLCRLVYRLLSPFPKYSKPCGRHCVLIKSWNNSVVFECRLSFKYTYANQEASQHKYTCAGSPFDIWPQTSRSSIFIPRTCKQLFIAMLIDPQDIPRLVINCMLLKETGC